MTISTVDKQAPAGTLARRVCPRCRRRDDEAGELGAITRCPDDGYAFVQAEQLARADGDPFLGATIAGVFGITNWKRTPLGSTSW